MVTLMLNNHPALCFSLFIWRRAPFNTKPFLSSNGYQEIWVFSCIHSAHFLCVNVSLLQTHTDFSFFWIDDGRSSSCNYPIQRHGGQPNHYHSSSGTAKDSNGILNQHVNRHRIRSSWSTYTILCYVICACFMFFLL